MRREPHEQSFKGMWQPEGKALYLLGIATFKESASLSSGVVVRTKGVASLRRCHGARPFYLEGFDFDSERLIGIFSDPRYSFYLLRSFWSILSIKCL